MEAEDRAEHLHLSICHASFIPVEFMKSLIEFVNGNLFQYLHIY